MHFVYFAEQKLERFYDFLVERTEEATARTLIKDVETKAAAKGKAKIGELLSRLGLGGIEIGADVSASGKLSFENQIVSKFTAPQKLRPLPKLDSEDKLVALSSKADLTAVPEEGTPVFFSARLKTDYDRRSETDIERKRAVVLTGRMGDFAIEVQASLEYMVSPNAWRRWERPRQMVGFATLIGVDHNERSLEFDPIVLAYAQPR